MVQDFDGSTASRNFIDAFRASITFHVVAWPVDQAAEEALASNAARAVLIIPPHFGRDMARGVNAPVQIMVDASDANTAKLVAGYGSQITAAYNRQTRRRQRRPRPCRLPSACGSTPASPRKSFTAPESSCWAISMFPPLLAALAMAKEGEQKTILQVYVSSISAHEFLLGKILAFMAVALGEALVMSSFLFTYFGLSFAGDPTPFISCHNPLRLLRGVVRHHDRGGHSQPGRGHASRGAGRISAGLPALRPACFPSRTFPSALRWISNFVWGRYYIEIVRDALLQGGGWPAVWYKVIIIGVIGSIFYTLAWRGMRRMQVKA